MTDVIKMEYDLMEDMARTFEQGANQLKETQSEVLRLAALLEDGALLGRSGDAFADALRGRMSSSIARLEQKFRELRGDVLGAMHDMQKADKQSEAQF